MPTNATGDYVNQKEAHQEWVKAARLVLEEVAKEYGATISYSQLAERVQADTGISTKQRITNWIGQVALEAWRPGEPVLSSLVVQLHTGRVGDGYKHAIAMVYPGVPSSDLQSHAGREREKCYQFFGAAEPVATDTWDIAVGEELKRREVHKRLGGSSRSSISVTRKTQNVLIFSNPKSSDEYECKVDEEREDGTIRYLGEGQLSNQALDKRGNKTIIGHMDSHRALRVFCTTTDTTVVRYLGQFVLGDPAYEHRTSPDRNGDERTVVVFNLVPVGGTAQIPESGTPITGSVRPVKSEAATTLRYPVSRGKESGVATRSEIQLQERYKKHLCDSGHSVDTLEITLPISGVVLKPDLVDFTNARIIEAKGGSDRGTVRMAIGQVLDYVHQVETIDASKYSPSLLLPAKPTDDLLNLAKAHGIEVVWESTKGSFSFS